MSKRGIILDLKGFEVFDLVPTKFGNGAHVLISKEYVSKRIKIIVGKTKVFETCLIFDFFNCDVLEGKAAKFGTGAHVIIPKSYIGKKIKIIVGGENEN